MTRTYPNMAAVRAAVFIATVLCALGGLKAQVPFIHAPAFDAVAVDADDRHQAEMGELPLYGRMLPIMAEAQHEGAWSEEGNERIWRLGIDSPGALALECFLDEVEVPTGATLRILSRDGTLLSGPVELDLSADVHEFSTAMVAGDACIIEYREPSGAARRGTFRVAQVSHAYRDVQFGTEREGSCHVNVTCEPESIGWEGPIRATVRISVVTPQGTGWCSGTLVNNVQQDCAPYILTAWHCGRTSTTAQFNQFKFYFNFQYATCSGGAYSTAQYITGAQLKAYSDDYAPQFGGIGGSDFMLLRTNASVPETFDPYWTGWDAQNISTVAADGVSIHHPSGSPKRISSFTQTLTTGHPMTSSGLLTHYRVKWAATQNGFGVVEEGSSGGGLFKPDATFGPLLIGTLTGSSSGMTCTNNSGTSYYGKMSYHWTNNPNTTIQKLKYWLDPDNTGTLVLGGSADPCAVLQGIAENEVQKAKAWPVPADGDLTIDWGIPLPTGSTCTLVDVCGRTVLTTDASTSTATARFDVSALREGTYIARLYLPGAAYRTIPVIIAH